MRLNQTKFKNLLHHIIQRFQQHLKSQFVIHKRSFKLCKGRTYKNGKGTKSQEVPKFKLPEQFNKQRFLEVKTKLQKEVGVKKEEKKEVTLKGDEKVSTEDFIKDFKIPGKPGGPEIQAKPEVKAKPLIVEMKDKP